LDGEGCGMGDGQG
jgi:midasin